MLGEGVERTLVPLVRRFEAQLGLVSDSQDALLNRLDTSSAPLPPRFVEVAEEVRRANGRGGARPKRKCSSVRRASCEQRRRWKGRGWQERTRVFLLTFAAAAMSAEAPGAAAAGSVTPAPDWYGAEREALVELYDTTDGPRWRAGPGENRWMVGCHCGSGDAPRGSDPSYPWVGVGCQDTPSPPPVDASGCKIIRVTSIYLGESILSTSRGLRGVLPLRNGTRGSLSNLTELVLSDNDLMGPLLPAFVTALSSLEILSLNNNQFSGALPAALSVASSLSAANFRDNEFTGTLPSEWAALSMLVFLQASNCSLSGTLPP